MVRIELSNVIVGPLPCGTDAILNVPSFKASEGERIGVVGLNGAGKTTFLKVLSGALVPNYGHCSVEGSVQPLINIAGGFDDNLSVWKTLSSFLP